MDLVLFAYPSQSGAYCGYCSCVWQMQHATLNTPWKQRSHGNIGDPLPLYAPQRFCVRCTPLSYHAGTMRSREDTGRISSWRYSDQLLLTIISQTAAVEENGVPLPVASRTCAKDGSLIRPQSGQPADDRGTAQDKRAHVNVSTT